MVKTDKTYRPRRLTYAEMQVRLREADQEASLLARAIQSLVVGSPDAERAVPGEPGQSYRAKLFRLGSPDGGLLVLTFFCQGQTPYATVHPLERWARDTYQWGVQAGSPGAMAQARLAEWAQIEQARYVERTGA